MLVALAKIGSPEMVGQFALGLAITAPVMMFASLKLRLVQATDAKGEYSFGDYLSLRLITTTLGLLVIVGIALIVDYDYETSLVILTLGVAKAFESISDVFYGLFQRQEQMDRIAKSLMIKGPLSLIALSIGVYLTGSVFGGTMGLVAIWVLVLFTYDVRSGALMLKSMALSGSAVSQPSFQAAALRPRWDLRTLAKLAWFVLPLGFVTLLDSLLVNIPRYFIEMHLGAYTLGIFAALASFERVGKLVVHALGRSVSPQLSQYYVARNIVAFRTLLLKIAGVGALMCGAAVVITRIAGDEILTLFYRPEYARQDVFVWLMAAAGIGYVAALLIYGVTAARHFRVQTFLYTFITTITVLFCILLIPSRGLHGAAMVFMIARCVELAGVLVILYICCTRSKEKRREEKQE